MKRTALTLALLVATSAASAAPWTYRGTLNDGGKAANGTYDLRVTLLNAAKTATVYGPTTLYDVKVVNGNFAAEVDFGTDLSAAPAMTLITEVQQGNSGFVPLGEAMPFDPKVALAGVCWDIEGNAGTNPATNFIGTTDYKALVLRANNKPAFRIFPSSESPNLVAGVDGNTVSGLHSGQVVAGGGSAANTCGYSGTNACINRTQDNYATVGGGFYNRSVGSASFVGGGSGNLAGGDAGVVGGGFENVADADRSTVAGGEHNETTGDYSTISGGRGNTAKGDYTTVGGGTSNAAYGDRSTIVGGYNNCAGGDSSWAGGSNVKIRPGTEAFGGTCTANSGTTTGDNGTFAWADDQATGFVSTGPRQFLVRAQGGMAINGTPADPNTELSVYGRASDPFGGFVEFRLTPTPALNGNTGEGIEIGVGPGGAGSNDASFRIAHRNNTLFADRFNLNSDGSVVIRSNTTGTNTGVTMAANGGSWSNLSDRRLKQDIVPVDALDVLDKVASLPMATWSYIAQGSGVRHIGPMAQDFAASFKVGENDTSISTIDADGVALAAIQGLDIKLEAQNAALRTQVEALLARVASLESTINSNPAERTP